jgi:hypothetical protein
MLNIDYKLSDGSFHKAFGGFWLKDLTLYPISKTHIRAVLDFPDLFNRKKPDLVNIFKKYNEKIGLEGKAREEIIIDLVSEDWIRIRHYFKPRDYWSIQCADLELQKKEIDIFLTYASNKFEFRGNEIFKINGNPIKIV